MRTILKLAVFACAAALSFSHAPAQAQQLTILNVPGAEQQLPNNIPGLVVWFEQRFGTTWVEHMQTRPNPYPAIELDGGDRGASTGGGFRWFAMMHPSANWSPEMMSRIPPGLVVGLKHTQNQANMQILAFNSVDVASTNGFPGFQRMFGGDIGAPSGQGFVWFESIGDGNVDWSLVDRLPKFTIMGLRHSINLRTEGNYRNQIFWDGGHSCTFQGNPVPCDCLNTQVAPPPGFSRIGRLDQGAPAGEGFCWYEKRY